MKNITDRPTWYKATSLLTKVVFSFFLLTLTIQAEEKGIDIKNFQCTEKSYKGIDQVIETQMVNQNLPGIAVGIVKGNKIVHLKGYGNKTHSKKYPIGINTVFRWASISKTLTAVSALQLSEKNSNFQLNDRVNKHVPYWSSYNNDRRTAAVRINHLLSHRSGINHYSWGINPDNPSKTILKRTFNIKKPQCNAGLARYNKKCCDADPNKYKAECAVSIFGGARLDFNPGDKYLYSSYGYNLLGAAIEERSPHGYVDWVKSNIARPLGMHSLRLATGSDFGVAYEKDGIIDTKKDGTKELTLPAGGWESNICDLAKFSGALKSGELLDDHSILYTNMQNGGSYRFGIRDFGTRYEHGGSHHNLKTLLSVYNRGRDDFSIVMFIPAAHANASRGKIRSELVRSLRGSSLKNSPAIDQCVSGSGKKQDSDRFHGVWRKTNEDVILRTGMKQDEFYNEQFRLQKLGYGISDFEPFIKDGVVRWDGVYKKGLSRRRMVVASERFKQFNKSWKEWSRRGYVLVNLETFVSSGERQWAGIFKKSNEKTALWRNFDTEQFAVKRNEMAKQGRKLVDIEVHVVNNKPRWSGVWLEGKDGLLNRNYLLKDFDKLRLKRRKSGYKLIDVETYKLKNKTYYAGIWEKSEKKEYLNSFYLMCDFLKKHDERSTDGYELIDWERVKVR